MHLLAPKTAPQEKNMLYKTRSRKRDDGNEVLFFAADPRDTAHQQPEQENCGCTNKKMLFLHTQIMQ